MRYKIFFTPACPKCPEVKEFVKENVKIEGEFIDASTPGGLEKAQKYGIMQAPTVIFLNESNEVLCNAHTVSEVKECLSRLQG